MSTTDSNPHSFGIGNSNNFSEYSFDFDTRFLLNDWDLATRVVPPRSLLRRYRAYIHSEYKPLCFFGCRQGYYIDYHTNGFAFGRPMVLRERVSYFWNDRIVGKKCGNLLSYQRMLISLASCRQLCNLCLQRRILPARVPSFMQLRNIQFGRGISMGSCHTMDLHI